MSNSGHTNLHSQAAQPRPANRGWSYLFLLLLLCDAVALIWFFAFVAVGAKESFEQWGILLGILGVSIELWIVPRLLKTIFKGGGWSKALAMLRRPENRAQVLVTTILVLLIVPPLYRVSFDVKDSFSGEDLEQPQVYLTGTRGQARITGNEWFRIGHYAFVSKKPPDFEDSSPLEETLTPIGLFRHARISMDLQPKKIQIAVPSGAKVYVHSRNGWQELSGFTLRAPAGCQDFRLLFPDGTRSEGYTHLSGESYREVLTRESLKASKGDCHP